MSAAHVMQLRHRLEPKVRPFLDSGEELRYVFMGANFDSPAMRGGSTRIVAVTDRSIVLIVTGMWHRTTPVRVEDRRPLGKLRKPDDIWPGTSLIGEMWGEALPGIWVHERYRPVVQKARDLVDWLYP